MKKHLIAAAGLLLTGLLASPSSHAYYSTMDTGELLNPGKYRLGLETQFITESNSGANVIGRFDMGFNEESNFRAELGVGEIDFHLGGYFKWVPIPDYQQQPAIGITTGVLFAQYGGKSEISLRFHPMISKGIPVEFGKITPYAALPIGLKTYDGNTDLPMQLALGTELFFQELNLWRFKGEVGFDLDDAFTYISFGASIDFDEENGFRFR